uniref:DUF7595 domain-containing protein n=1 Tax=Leersia perrieri TaxID=77586 RepID=A0A0D9VZM2_9ORYZ
MSTGSTTGGRTHACQETPEDNTDHSQPPPPLCFDIGVEIAERLQDATTIIRCVSSICDPLLRRAILGDGFRRHLSSRAAANGGFDPGLLLGFSYILHENGRRRFVHAPPARFDESLLDTFTPAASRDGLLLLTKTSPSRDSPYQKEFLELIVCNTLTGETISPPPLEITKQAFTYPPALLAVANDAGAGCSFEVIVVEKCLSIHTYKSTRGNKWVNARGRTAHRWPTAHVDGTSAAVTGRAVHWLCYCNYDYQPNSGEESAVVFSVDADTAIATLTNLPEGCFGRDTGAYGVEGIHLAGASSPSDGSLRLVAVGLHEISVWTLTPASPEASPISRRRRWSKRAMIRVEEGIGNSLFGESWKPIRMRFECGRMCPAMRVMGFAERSGVGLVWMEGCGLVRFSLATAELAVVHRCAGEVDFGRSSLVRVLA